MTDTNPLAPIEALVGDWQANGNSRPLGDPTAGTWHEAARQLMEALAATHAPRPAQNPARSPLAAIEALADDWERYRRDTPGDLSKMVANCAAELRAALAEARQAVDALMAERDAYRRAKQENDERFMLERDEARAERDAAREALARVEALQVHWETALGLNSCPACGHIPEMDCDHGEGYHHALSDIRAALAQPATDEEAGQ